MKKILVPIDFSEQAIHACKVAASIAKKTNSEIILLHMLDVPSGSVDPADSGNLSGGGQTIFYLKSISKKFNELKASPFFEDVTVSDKVLFHKAFEGVIEESKKNDVDLIVMGSQGATGLKEMLVGSNTEKVVRLSHIPVLVIKQDIDDFKIDDLIFASDFSDESKKSFQKVIDFATIFKSKIHLLYITTIGNFEPTKTSEKRLQDFITGFKLNDYTINIYNDRTIEEGILNFGREINADVIAIYTHGRSGLSQLFSESISKELANHALRPVVTFRI
ncbi:MAG: universal stress protein [Flavobacteriaceae bacterium]|jgi:nucleotide-binding universal stress UspA family protein|nr:universal stress protein [Flavobacteriaceae bacterium]